MAHEHILTKDADGDVWVVVLEMDEVRLYPFIGEEPRVMSRKNANSLRHLSPSCPRTIPSIDMSTKVKKRHLILETFPLTRWPNADPKMAEAPAWFLVCEAMILSLTD